MDTFHVVPGTVTPKCFHHKFPIVNATNWIWEPVAQKLWKNN